MNNSKILAIKIAKFSGYYFYMNLNIQGDFQICISVPLKTRTAVNAKISVFVIRAEVITYLLIYNLHDCTFQVDIF